MKTEIIAILDKSGSMAGLESDTIGGYNKFIDDQKKLEGECNVTLVLFDHEYEKVYEAKPVNDVPALTNKEYAPRGTTALLDAIGRATDEAGKRFTNSAEKPDKVIVLITTDGFENASRDYTVEKIRDMIKHQEDKYSWEYIYLGANQDAFTSGLALGMKMSNISNYSATARGTDIAFASFSGMTAAYRTGTVTKTMSQIVDETTAASL